MQYIKLLFFLSFICHAMPTPAQENAAPSMHLSYYFPSADAVLKMQKIKIVQSAYASYFEVNWFTNGYAGLQQTPDNSYGNSNILISSLWDPNTSGGIFSRVDYNHTSTRKSRFGGEGDGWKTINPYDWKLNTWYNIVNRAWKSYGRLYIGTFINDLSTGIWFHTATLSIPYPQKYLNSYNDAFLENWDGWNSAWNGSAIRKAFFRDCWNINTRGTWEKNSRAYCSVNNSEADIRRNGAYHNSFNAWYDQEENAYVMQHGGNTTPSDAFNGGRTLNLPAQSGQGTKPLVSTPVIDTLSALYSGGQANIDWEIDDTCSPQFSARIEIIDPHGSLFDSFQDTVPQRRTYTPSADLLLGTFSVRLSVWDIFNQPAAPLTTHFTVSGTPVLELSADTVTVTSDISEAAIDITSNVFWSAESNQDWLAVDPATGSGNAPINLTATENTGKEPRIATVTVSEVTGISQTVTLIQDGLSSGIEDYVLENTVIFPNPFRDILYISPGLESASVSVFNSAGQQVLQGQISHNQINLGNLPAGIYTLRIRDGKSLLVKRLVKL